MAKKTTKAPKTAGVRCPKCKAEPGAYCQSKAGRRTSTFHAARTKAAIRAEKKPAVAKKAPAKGTAKAGTLFRIATVVNPKTDRPATVPVKADGSQLPRWSYLPAPEEWRVVRAGSWAEASAAAKAGEGELVKAGSNGKKVSKPKRARKPKAKAAKKAEETAPEAE